MSTEAEQLAAEREANAQLRKELEALRADRKPSAYFAGTSQTANLSTASMKVSLKPPDRYKPQQRFETWWIQLTAFMTAAMPDVPDEQKAAFMTNTLSTAAFDGLLENGISANDLTNPRSVEQHLRARFGDKTTPAMYLVELRSMQQSSKEDAGTFFDRVRSILIRAYPHADITCDQTLRQTLLDQLVTGLKLEQLRILIQAEMSCTNAYGTTIGDTIPLPELRARLKILESSVLKGMGKQPVCTSNIYAEPQSSDTKSHLQADEAGPAKEKPGGKSEVCQLCHKPGHVASDCHTLPGNMVTSANARNDAAAPTRGRGGSRGRPPGFRGPMIICFRCGKPGHRVADCFATTHRDGYELPAKVSVGADGGTESKPTSSMTAEQTLNCMGGPCAKEAVSAPLRQW